MKATIAKTPKKATSKAEGSERVTRRTKAKAPKPVDSNSNIELAVIKTGGKQYIVKLGQKLKIEKLEKEVGEEITFDEVLLVQKDDKVEIGSPLVKGAKVVGKVTTQGKGKKIVIFKYKPKVRYRRKAGHRQLFTEVEITKIES